MSHNRPLRIVSLLPAATDIVAAMGLSRELVGRSHACDFPAGAAALPAVTAARIDTTGNSLQIHQQVGKAMREPKQPIDAASVYRIDTALLRRLKPDLILTQNLCDVCAVSADEVRRAVAESIGGEVEIVSLHATDLEGSWRDIERVGLAVGEPEKARELVASLKARVETIARRAAELQEKPSVVCLEWLDPLMAAGNWVPELVALAGGRELIGKPAAHSQWMEWDEFHAADPDVIVLLPCGFDLAKTHTEARRLFKHPGFLSYKAVNSGRVALADGNRFFNRPGPRLVESLEILTEIIHPGAFQFGHERSGWMKMPR